MLGHLKDRDMHFTFLVYQGKAVSAQQLDVYSEYDVKNMKHHCVIDGIFFQINANWLKMASNALFAIASL